MKLTGSGKMMGTSYSERNKPSVSTELRNNEYYDMQNTFDWLYDKSKNHDTKGIDLYNLIISRNNILLAYRNL